MRRSVLVVLLCLLFPLYVAAEDLTQESITGKWIFTHMNLDGTGDRPVNLLMEFLPDGEVISSDSAGNEKGRASYSIDNGRILYVDERGTQKWRVEKFEGDELQVNHSGARMFFTRQ